MNARSAPTVELGSDELGAFARIRVDCAVYSETAILKTAYWLTDEYYIFISRSESGEMTIELRLKDASDTGAVTKTAGAFANVLLDNEVRQRVLAETSGVRDMLIKKAFFEARRAPPPGLLADESKVTCPGQTAKDDPAGAGKAR